MAVVATAERQAGGLADLERQFWRDDTVGTATDAVSAEVLANHTGTPPHTFPRPIVTRSVSRSVQKMLDNLTTVNNAIFTMLRRKA
jgi:hypothetical protein